MFLNVIRAVYRSVRSKKLIDVGKLSLSAHVSELARSGLVRLGGGKIPKDVWKLPRPVDKQGRGLKVLLDEREDGR